MRIIRRSEPVKSLTIEPVATVAVCEDGLRIGATVYPMTRAAMWELRNALGDELAVGAAKRADPEFRHMRDGETWVLPAPDDKHERRRRINTIRVRALRALGAGNVKVKMHPDGFHVTRKDDK